MVHIYFDTPTFDRVEKDVKVIIPGGCQTTDDRLIVFFLQVTLVAQLGVIGGTMGLFTGFSILSGIEIIYFAAKFFFKKIKSYESKL